MTKIANSERRKETRRATSMKGLLNHSRAGRRPVAIVDLSSEGFNADLGVHPVAADGAFSVKLGGLEVLGAELRWLSDMNAGFRFERPLHPAVLDHVVRAHPRADVED